MTTKYPIIFILALTGYLGYTFYMHLQDSMYMSIIDRVDFFIHEFGHILFSLSGSEIWTILGGTLLQLIIPVAVGVMFLFQRDNYAVAVCLAWIGTNLFYIAHYSSDAIAMQLTLIGIGSGEVIHDWNYIFSHFGILIHTYTISGCIYYSAIAFFILSFIYTGILLINKIRDDFGW